MHQHLKTTTGLALALALVAGIPAHAEKAGVTAAVNPDAQGTPPGEPTRVLKLGLDIARNEHIVTSSAGLTQLLFNDGSTLSLGPDADVTIDNFVYDPKTGSGKMALTLGKGVMRLVGGQIANSSDVAVTTPTATIGIRGAIGGVSVGGDGSTTAYLAYGKNLSVAGRSGGPTQNVTQGNFAISVKPGQPASPPVPLSSAVLQTVTAALEPPANSGGGASSKPTEQSVQNSTGSGSALNSPPPTPKTPAPEKQIAKDPVSLVPTTQQSTGTSSQDVTQNASQDTTTTGAISGDAQTPLPANATFGPYVFNSYRATTTTGFSTDANGYVTSFSNGAYLADDPSQTRIANENTVSAIGTPVSVTTLGQAQIGIWLGSTLVGEHYDSNGNLVNGTVVSNLPGNYYAAAPTTTMPQSGTVVYQLSAATPVVNSFTDADGNSTGSILSNSKFIGKLAFTFGKGGPNSAAGLIEGDVLIPGEATLSFKDTLVNYPLTRFFYFTSNSQSPVSVGSGTSSYCNSSTICTVWTQGYFSGIGGVTQIALGYDIYYTDAATQTTSGNLSGSALFQYLSNTPGGIGPSTVGFWPDSALAAVQMRSGGLGLKISSEQFDLVRTGADGVPHGSVIVPVAGSGQIVEQGGDVYAQALRITGDVVAFGSPATLRPGGMHQILAIPTIGLPTSGSTSYDLAFATTPTYSDGYGGPGNFTGNLSSTFTPSGATVALTNMAARLPDATYNFSPVSVTGVTKPLFVATSSTSGPSGSHLCPAGCTIPVDLKGLFAGPGAQRVALLYSLRNSVTGMSINGAGIFRASTVQ
jgi:hypothetical protein